MFFPFIFLFKCLFLGGKINWSFISIFSSLLIVAVFLCLVMTLYCAFELHHSDSYNLAKKEAKAKKQMEMEGITDVEKAPIPSVVEVDEAKVVNYINQNVDIIVKEPSDEEIISIQDEDESEEIESEV